MQEILSDILETDLFKQLIEHQFGESVEVPEIKWKPIWEPTVEDKAKFLVGLVQQGIVTPVEARMQLGLPVKPEDGTLPKQPAEVQEPGKGGGAAAGQFGSQMLVRKDGQEYIVSKLKPKPSVS